ncbi:MAG: hypothetical protein A3K22_03540 [Deltaproteobacteria bacterium RBG_16_42_7]|nr:MAG: hypothetical protein A3K22_03540 [Deltaproteobacteria bacterium RBG_16_42_7]
MKNKRHTEEFLKDKLRLKAKRLLLNEDYRADLKKYNKATTILTKYLDTDKYDIVKPYDLKTLEDAANGKIILAAEVCDIVNIMKEDKKYIYIRIRKDEPKHCLLYYMDRLFDVYLVNKPKTRFRREQNGALEVWAEWMKLGLSAKKGFPKIAKKLNIPLSTAKSRWYRAHEILFKQSYEPQSIKEEGKAVELCSRCKDITCYKDRKIMDWIPCYEYIRLAGKRYQREKTMSKKQFNTTHFGEIQDEE